MVHYCNASYKNHPGFEAVKNRARSGELDLLEKNVPGVWLAVPELQSFDLNHQGFYKALQRLLHGLRKEMGASASQKQYTKKRARVVEDSDNDDVCDLDVSAAATKQGTNKRAWLVGDSNDDDEDAGDLDALIRDESFDFSLVEKEDLEKIEAMLIGADDHDEDERQKLSEAMSSMCETFNNQRKDRTKRRKTLCFLRLKCTQVRVPQTEYPPPMPAAASMADPVTPTVPTPTLGPAPAAAPNVPTAPSFAAASAAAAATGQGFSMGSRTGVRPGASTSSLFED